MSSVTRPRGVELFMKKFLEKFLG